MRGKPAGEGLEGGPGQAGLLRRPPAPCAQVGVGLGRSRRFPAARPARDSGGLEQRAPGSKIVSQKRGGVQVLVGQYSHLMMEKAWGYSKKDHQKFLQRTARPLRFYLYYSQYQTLLTLTTIT